MKTFEQEDPRAHSPEAWERGFGRRPDGRDPDGGDRGGRPHHPRGPGGKHGGRERPFAQGDLRFLVLQLVAEQPRHGYEIIKALEEATGGRYSPSPGVIYPTLTLLEETGVLSAEAQGAKRLYSLTDEGRAHLEAEAEQVAAVRARFEEARRRFAAGPAPEIRRAMENLHGALRVRLGKGELAPEAVAAVTAALDRAAGEIERG